MTGKRFFILKDDEDEDTLPVIRDKTFKINDIYGHYKYDNLNEICNELNSLVDKNEQLKQSNQELYDKLQETMSYKALKMGENSINKKENEQLKKDLERLSDWYKLKDKSIDKRLKG